MPYNINKNYFDEIDTENKAYWLGFWWCDGYVGRRERWIEKSKKYKIEYNFKCSLSVQDKNHLEKFKIDLNSSHPIHIYKASTAYKNNYYEARLFITNKYMGKILQDKYGLIPHRHDCTKLIKNIPKELFRHFVRGVLDADGSFSWYHTIDRSYEVLKCNVQFATYEMLINYIEKFLFKNKIINNEFHKKEQRHKDRDEYCKTLHLSGRIQAINVLNYLYKNANIYLERKYLKYNNMLKDCVCK